MHSLALAVVKSGILPEEALAEFRRWGHDVETPPPIPKDPKEIVQALEQALQDEGLVVTRETDLEAVTYFLMNQLQGELYVVLEEEGHTETSGFPCNFGITPMGDYIIQWHSESIEEVMTNGKTHLNFQGKDTLGAHVEVYFNRVREIFFGDTKAFMICTPVPPVKSNG
jgi:hypothetical protein